MEKTLRQGCSELKISRRTIQGYEKAGLVVPSGKNKYGHLLYDDQEQDMIRFIRFCQQAGFSLKEIGKLSVAPNDVRKKAFLTRIRELEKKRTMLEELIRQVKQYVDEL